MTAALGRHCDERGFWDIISTHKMSNLTFVCRHYVCSVFCLATLCLFGILSLDIMSPDIMSAYPVMGMAWLMQRGSEGIRNEGTGSLLDYLLFVCLQLKNSFTHEQNIAERNRGRHYTKKTIFSFPFKWNGIWSWWQFYFWFWTKLKSICFEIERKTVTTIISHSIWK